jgi:hypothetical protein
MSNWRLLLNRVQSCWFALAWAFIQCAHAESALSPSTTASASTKSTALPEHKGVLSSAGSVRKVMPTLLGEVELVDTSGDGTPDTAVLKGETLVPPRKASNGGVYGLQEVSFDGKADKRTGRVLRRRLVLSQSFGSCQYIFLDFTGPKVWVSQRFPDAEEFPAWASEKTGGCIGMTWVAWKQPYSFFYFAGPEHPAIFAHNPKLQAVFGPIDPDQAPPHPKSNSLAPGSNDPCFNVSGVEECRKEQEATKRATQHRN